MSAQNIKRNDNGISCPTASVHLQAMGELADSQAWCGTFWLHWGHSSANTWSREIIHASKSIGWRLNSSILHHLLMQKKRYLCTEQVTKTRVAMEGWPVILTDLVNVSAMRQIPLSKWKAVELDTCQRVQMNQYTTQHAMWDIYALSCMSKIQGKYKIYLKYKHICTKCFLMHIQTEVRVVKSKVWALKDQQTAREIAWTSETEEGTWMYILKCPGHWKLTGKLYYAIFKK